MNGNIDIYKYKSIWNGLSNVIDHHQLIMRPISKDCVIFLNVHANGTNGVNISEHQILLFQEEC